MDFTPHRQFFVAGVADALVAGILALLFTALFPQKSGPYISIHLVTSSAERQLFP
jgi:hypothetical protein